MNEIPRTPNVSSLDPLQQSMTLAGRCNVAFQAFLTRRNARPWATLLVDGGIAAGGGWILWSFAAGQTVADPTVVGTGLYLLLTTTLLNLRRLVSGRKRGRSGYLGIVPFWGQFLEYARDLMVIVLAAVSVTFSSYLLQWLITYAALLLAVSGVGRLIFQLFVQPSFERCVLPGVAALSGLLGLLMTASVHQYNLPMLLFLAVLFVVAEAIGLVLIYWYEVVIDTVPGSRLSVSTPDAHRDRGAGQSTDFS